ncbi:MAG: PKD domain-containing protein [Bacteroidetes bacterium]|nr:PKD domain-containing protein [Bacteroidota bacterium]
MANRIIFISISLLFCAHISSAQLNAGFNASSTSGCAPIFVNFTDISTGTPTSWLWDLGNGNQSTLQNPSAIYKNPGIYSIKLIISDGSGTDSSEILISVFASPQSDFTTDTSNGCTPLLVNFSDKSSPGSTAINDWFWDFGDGTVDSIQNPSHTYINPGVYSVYFQVIDLNGCKSYIFKTLVVGGPTADFSFPTPVCPFPANINFLNKSKGTALSYAWDFGDTTFSSMENPGHIYTSYNTFQVQLAIMDSMGCVDTIQKTISITNFQADFNFEYLDAKCDSSYMKIAYRDSSTPSPIDWQWDFGDGSTSIQPFPDHNYSSTGPYTVTLIVTHSPFCKDTITKIIHYKNPVAAFSPDTSVVCNAPYTINFINSSTGTVPLSYKWEFGDTISGQNNFSAQKDPSYNYVNPTKYFVKLVVTDIFGCVDSISDTLNIIKAQALFHSFWPFGCIPLTVQFIDTSKVSDPIVTWEWHFGDPASGSNDTSFLQYPTHTYQDTGWYDVTLIITTAFGCKDTLTIPDFSRSGIPPDTVDFYWLVADTFLRDTICKKHLLYFYDQSGYVDTSYIVNTWYWNFYWHSAGFGPNFHWYSDKDYAKQGYNMVTDYWATVPDPLHQYTYGYGTFDDYIWPNGDTGCISVDSIHFGYDTVILMAGMNFCADTIYKYIFVDSPYALPGIIYPLGSCGKLAGCAPPDTFGFYNASKGFNTFYFMRVVHQQTGDTIKEWVNTTDTNFITFTKAGYYNISVSVRNDSTKCNDSRTFIISFDSVLQGFIVNPEVTCFRDHNISFSDTTRSIYGVLKYWDWYFGDGDTLSNYHLSNKLAYIIDYTGSNSVAWKRSHLGRTGGTYQNPTHIYRDTGTYIIKSVKTVELPYYFSSIHDSIQCTYIDYDTVTINGIFPGFSANDTTTCPGTSIIFNDSSYSPAAVLKWSWNFGDSSAIDSNQNPSHTYTKTGNYTVTMAIEDGIGCVDTLTKTKWLVVTQPDVDFEATPTIACLNDTIFFRNKSYGGGFTYLWNFGDSNTDTSWSPSHIYTTAGTYNITLTVTDSNSCDSTLVLTNYIQIGNTVQAGFTIDTNFTECPPLLVRFIDSSSTNVVQWNWNFGDSTVSILKNPLHIFNYSGLFDITLVVTDSFGCEDTVTKSSLIRIDGPYGTFNADPDSGCTSLSLQFVANTINTDLYAWDMGDGTVLFLGNNGDTVNYTYNNPGIFEPILILQDSFGCTYSTPPNKKIYVDELEANFETSDSVFCFYDSIFITNTSTSYFKPKGWYWDFGDGVTDTLENPVHYLDSAGSYNIVLVLYSPVGCTDTFTQLIDVYERPKVTYIISDKEDCAPFTVDFNADTTANLTFISSWYWDFGDGNTSTLQKPSHPYTAAGNYEVKFFGYYANDACFIDTTIIIKAYDPPIALFDVIPLNDNCLVMDSFALINSSISSNAYIWDFGDGGATDIKDPVHAYNDSGVFTIKLIATNQIGCLDSLQFDVLVYNNRKDFIMPNVFTPLPNSPGQNDLFYINDLPPKSSLKVYSRWGALIYKSDDYQNDWDGGDAENGVYFYILRICPNQSISGYVHILREH